MCAMDSTEAELSEWHGQVVEEASLAIEDRSSDWQNYSCRTENLTYVSLRR
jgi:hypothetical protein